MGQRPGQDDRRKQLKRPVDDTAIRARADELHAAGMPHQMALAVAHGKLRLNEALERLARRDAVNRLMEKHDLSRALATQIALGQASLADVLARRRLTQHRDDNRDRSILDEAVADSRPLTLLLHGNRRAIGRVVLVDSYMFRFQPEEGEAEDLHKLQVKIAFSPDAYKKVKKSLRVDKKVQEAPAGPIARPQDRYTCSDKRLFRYLDQGTEVQATTLEGDQVRGQVTWFSRYEFGLRLKGDVELVVFRHALADLREV